MRITGGRHAARDSFIVSVFGTRHTRGFLSFAAAVVAAARHTGHRGSAYRTRPRRRAGGASDQQKVKCIGGGFRLNRVAEVGSCRCLVASSSSTTSSSWCSAPHTDSRSNSSNRQSAELVAKSTRRAADLVSGRFRASLRRRTNTKMWLASERKTFSGRHGLAKHWWMDV